MNGEGEVFEGNAVPEAFVEVTVSSTKRLRSLVSHRPQAALPKNAMQEDYRMKMSLGGFPVHTPELLTRLDRGEEAWVPDLQSSDESTDEGPVKPTLKRWPKGSTWWDRYRSPTKYPSSDSSSSDEDQRSEVDDEKAQHGGHRLTILRRSVLDSSRGNGLQSVKPKEPLNNGSQPKSPPGSQAGKTKSYLTEAGESPTKEKVAEEHLVSCPACGRSFKSKISLSNHQRVHREKTYECSLCGKGFATQDMLTSHQVCHAEEKDNLPSSDAGINEIRPEAMPHKCLECKKCFRLKDHLLLHQRKHAAEGSHKPSKGGKGFPQKKRLAKHKKLRSGPKTSTLPKKKVREEDSPGAPEKRPSAVLVGGKKTGLSGVGATNPQEAQASRYKCRFCGRCLRTKTLLVVHERVHKEPKPYRCSKCRKSFHFKNHLKLHQKIHTKKNTCQYCGKRLSTTGTLANHEKLHTGERPYKCNECPQGFIRKYYLLRHQKVHKQIRHREYKKSLKSRQERNRLPERIHTGPNRYQDFVHMQSFSRNSCLATYQKSHTEGKYYKCQHCGVYMKRGFINRHMKIHVNKKTYQCVKCLETFFQKAHLAAHQKSHVRKKLSLCFDSEGKRIRKRSPSTLRREDLLPPKLPCCYCRKSFSNHYSLARHQKTHSGGKLLRYSICDQGFTDDWRLKRHEETHLKGSGFKQPSAAEVANHRMHLLQKPYVCAICGKGFFETWLLKRHVKAHLKKTGIKQPIVTKINHVVSSTRRSIFSPGKGRGGPTVKIKPRATAKIPKTTFSEDISESETEPQPVLSKGSETGAPETSELQNVQVKAHVKLSRKSNQHCQQNSREGPAGQALTPEKNPGQEDNVILHYKQDKHCTRKKTQPQKSSKKAHLGSSEMVRASWQSRSQTMPRRSKRGLRLAGQRVRSCFCQKEGPEMPRRKISSNSKICKKSQKSHVGRKVEACSQRPPIATVSSGLFTMIQKNCSLKSSRLRLPPQRTLPGGSKMGGTESAAPGWSPSSEREPEEVSGEEPGSNTSPRSCRTKGFQTHNGSDQAEPQVSPRVSPRYTGLNIGNIQIAGGPTDAGLQKGGAASIGQQTEEQPESAEEPLSGSYEEGGGCTEPLRKRARGPQSSARRRTTIAGQQQAEETPPEYICTQCNKSFRSRENLFVHEKNHKESRPFPCIRCEKSFYTMQSLNAHLIIHTGEKPFKCTECDFCSKTSSALNRHRKTHAQWKPYSCQQCKESFWFVHSLILHLEVHNTKEPHRCSDCGLTFRRGNGLALHRKSKHSSKAAK